jgi:hypothetical protein
VGCAKIGGVFSGNFDHGRQEEDKKENDGHDESDCDLSPCSQYREGSFQG